jgi:E3 ubiquitin-protein ligase DOA10
VSPPASDPINENVTEGTPVWNTDRYEQTWVVSAATPEEIADRTKEAQDLANFQEIQNDTFVQNFIAMTPTQIETYVENNTANVAEVRALLKKIAKMLLHLARNGYE